MANPSFTDALSTMRRRAQLSGRPLTKQESAGAVAGMAETASDRLYRGRMADLEQQRVDMAKQRDDRQYRLAKKQGKRDSTASTLATAGTGAAIGAYAGGPVGAAVGGAVGLVVGVASKACIIISACTDPQSYEVEVSRIYRDNCMSNFELIGYYTIAPRVAGMIHKNRNFKRLVKSQLVDRLVDYAEWLFGIKPKMKSPFISRVVTRAFLGLCRTVGKHQFYKKGICYHG